MLSYRCFRQLDDLVIPGFRIATLTATFFASSPEHPPAPKADVIIPVTTLANDTGNDASVPPIFSVRESEKPLGWRDPRS